MHRVLKTAMVAAMATGLLFAGSSCKELKKQVAEKVVQETTKKVVTPEGCDLALGSNLTDEDKTAFQEKLGKISEPVAQVPNEKKLEAIDGMTEDVRGLFAEFVKKADADAKCTDMLTDKFMVELKQKVADAM